MGLDMYLKASKYVGGWNHSDDAEKAQFKAVTEALGLQAGDWTEDSPSVTCVVTVGYWRKANAIHKWFVDTCQEAYVDRSKLKELLAKCKAALADRSKAGEILPPAEGFFFGSTELSEWYFQDLERTVVIITGILSNPRLERCDFYYHSSW